MQKELIGKLQDDGFTYDPQCEAYDNGNTRVYADDIDIIVVRFTGNKCIHWRNRIDGNMPVSAQKKLIDVMVTI